jgi:hypothetical protein
MMKVHGFLTLAFLATVVSAGSSPSLEEAAAATARNREGRGSIRNIHPVSLFVSSPGVIIVRSDYDGPRVV